jgi:hypothetical protein
LLNPNLTPAEAWARCVAAAEQIKQFDPIAKVRELYGMFTRTINPNVGVLSLTEDPCSTPMWAHYAQQIGLVIGLFDRFGRDL